MKDLRVFAGVDYCTGNDSINVTDFAFFSRVGVGLYKVKRDEKTEGDESKNNEALVFDVHLI